MSSLEADVAEAEAEVAELEQKVAEHEQTIEELRSRATADEDETESAPGGEAAAAAVVEQNTIAELLEIKSEALRIKQKLVEWMLASLQSE